MGLGWGFADSLKTDHVKIDTKDGKDSLLLFHLKSLNNFIIKKKDIIAHLNASSNSLMLNRQKLDSLTNDTIIIRNQLLITDNDSLKKDLSARMMADTNLIKRLKIDNEILRAQVRSDSAPLKVQVQ